MSGRLISDTCPISWKKSTFRTHYIIEVSIMKLLSYECIFLTSLRWNWLPLSTLHYHNSVVALLIRVVQLSLPAYLGSALVNIIPFGGCCGFWFVSHSRRLHSLHLPSLRCCRTRESLQEKSKSLHYAHCLVCTRRHCKDFCHYPAFSNSGFH